MKYAQTTRKRYIIAGILCSGFLVCGAMYIYGVNTSTVHTLAIEKNKRLMREMEEQLRALEVERSHLTVGVSLEKQAGEQNLFAARTIFYISRDSAVAQLNQ